MSLNDAPAFREANPDLALTATRDAGGRCALELEGDAAKVTTKGDDVETRDRASETT